MRIYERTNYGLADIINQINSDFGLSMIKSSDTTGYILLEEGSKLLLSFTDDDKLDYAKILLPSNLIDITDTTKTDVAGSYISAIETSSQVVALIERMTSGNSPEYSSNEEEEVNIEIENSEDNRLQ